MPQACLLASPKEPPRNLNRSAMVNNPQVFGAEDWQGRGLYRRLRGKRKLRPCLFYAKETCLALACLPTFVKAACTTR
jgi:hypothetical protein